MKEKMEIKKGDWFRCIEDIHDLYKKDEVYLSERDGCLNTIKGWNCSIDQSHFAHFEKLYTIQDFKDGVVAMENDGTVEELNEVLNYAFPNTHDCLGTFSYYRLNITRTRWRGVQAPGLPTQSVKDFLVQLPEEESVEESDLDFTMPPIPASGTIKGGIYTNGIQRDPINPDHYSFNIKGTRCDVFDIANAMGLDIEQATALRYFRKKKDPIEDTKKAIKCLERYLEKLEEVKP